MIVLRKLRWVLAAGVLSLASLAPAAGVYKWVDEEGKVHYGDRPGAENAEAMSIKSSPGPPSGSAAPNAAERRQKTKRLLDAYETERKETQAEKEKAEAERARREKNCTMAQNGLRFLEEGGRIYDVDEKGQRRYLDAADYENRKTQARAQVKKWCGPSPG